MRASDREEKSVGGLQFNRVQPRRRSFSPKVRFNRGVRGPSRVPETGGMGMVGLMWDRDGGKRWGREIKVRTDWGISSGLEIGRITVCDRLGLGLGLIHEMGTLTTMWITDNRIAICMMGNQMVLDGGITIVVLIWNGSGIEITGARKSLTVCVLMETAIISLHIF